MAFNVALSALYVVTVLGAMAVAFGMSRLQQRIDTAIARNAETLREINETWKRCVELNDKTTRTLKVIEKKNKEGEGWKNG